jgi:hypothetical protein
LCNRGRISFSKKSNSPAALALDKPKISKRIAAKLIKVLPIEITIGGIIPRPRI